MHIQMAKTKSAERVEEFNSNSFQSKRKFLNFSWNLKANPKEVFPLLCATKEADWLQGTTHKLIFTTTGYAEKDYVFKSDYFGLGEEIWVRHEHIVNEYLAYYRFSSHLLIKFEINLKDNHDNSVKTDWRLTYTSLDKKGNDIIGDLPSELNLEPIMKSLQLYLNKIKTS